MWHSSPLKMMSSSSISSNVKCYTFVRPKTKRNYWENKENIHKFLSEIKQKYNFNTPQDWNSFTQKQIKTNGGSSLLNKFSIFEIKCMACPEGKSFYTNQPKPSKYWENQENINKFLEEIKLKYNLQTPEDWNSITVKQIKSHGGAFLFNKYSMFELKCMACPDGKLIYNNPIQPKPSGYWEIQENILQFLGELKKKYNIQTPEDWNSISQKIIQSNGGSTLLTNYTMYELKCLACPEGKNLFTNQYKPSGYWENKENILQYLNEIKQKYNIQTPEDWNSMTAKQIKSNGGGFLLNKYSMYELKCIACPEGENIFTNQYKPSGYWENKKNILKFLEEIKQKYNLNTQEDWNSISQKHIKSNGGSALLNKYSMYELKCLAYPEGKLFFNTPIQPKPTGFWENKENVHEFLYKIKLNYNLQSPEDWNFISQKQIQFHGGSSLLNKYSLYELKCMACPEGKPSFNTLNLKPSGYWDDETNRNNFFEKLKSKYQLNTLLDWQRLSKRQIISQGGNWLFTGNYAHLKIKVQYETLNKEIVTKTITFKELFKNSIRKRSSQRWLFLQIQKLFPNEEIVEDYFHSEISRLSGANVQFDVFMMQRKIAFEYHGEQHYEDLPSGFSNLEMYKSRDLEKETLCNKYGIQLIVIPYWWDNKLESLKETINKLM